MRYEVEFLHVVRHPLKQQVHSFVSSGRGQVCPDMPKVLYNKINLLVYSLFFITTPTRSKTYMLAPSDTRHKWNVHKTSSERRMYIQFTSWVQKGRAIVWENSPLHSLMELEVSTELRSLTSKLRKNKLVIMSLTYVLIWVGSLLLDFLYLNFKFNLFFVEKQVIWNYYRRRFFVVCSDIIANKMLINCLTFCQHWEWIELQVASSFEILHFLVCSSCNLVLSIFKYVWSVYFFLSVNYIMRFL